MNTYIEKNTWVTLTLEEMYIGALGGILRRIRKWKNLREDQWGADHRDGWQLDIEGACGELAFASASGLFWRGPCGVRVDDIDGIEVRTASKDNYRLIVTPSDPENKMYVLMVGKDGRYRFAGSIMGYEAKVEKYLDDPNQQGERYFVPQCDLVDFHMDRVPRE